MKRQEMEENVPNTNLTTGTWIRLILKFPDYIIKCIQERPDAEEFSIRLLHARLSKHEISKFEKALNPYKDDEDYENIDMPKPDALDEFLKIISKRKQKRKILVMSLSNDEQKYVKKLIPYGINITEKFMFKDTVSLMLDNEGSMYLADVMRGYNGDDVTEGLKIRIQNVIK